MHVKSHVGCSGASSKGVSQVSSFCFARLGLPRRVPLLRRGSSRVDQVVAADVEVMEEESGGVKSGS